MSFVKCRPKH